MLTRYAIGIVLAVTVVIPVHASPNWQTEKQSTSSFHLPDIVPSDLENFLKEIPLNPISTDDDPDGCCIQSNGTGIACSINIKKKQCFDDCKETGCTAKWHAGYCKLDDNCGEKPTSSQQP